MFLPVDPNAEYYARLTLKSRAYEAHANRSLDEAGPRISVVVLPFMAGQYRICTWNDHTGMDSEPDIVFDM